ncbi:MAG TPA: hypothetical protein VE309_12730 [Caulobacteraceae bacterium]|jgi:hypothetical protein|nr:hypothetical protein [Caulobacteraceae bacterium]
MNVLGVFDQRFRGFRVIEIGGVGVLLALILLVYLAKTIAGGQSAQIDRAQQQIADEKTRVALLRAEVASLEQPERLESLSARYLNLQPVDAKHEIDAQALTTIAHADAPPASTQSPGARQTTTPQATTPAPPAPTVVAANPTTAKSVKLAAAAQPDPAKPAKTAKVAVAHPAATEPTNLAADTQTGETASAPAAPAETRRASELKPPALDPIGALTAPPAGSGDQ